MLTRLTRLPYLLTRSHLTRRTMHTVGLISHTGRIGSATLAPLLAAKEHGQIELIILHRASSNLTSIPDDVEKRVVDLGGEVSAIKSAVAGINVMM